MKIEPEDIYRIISWGERADPYHNAYAWHEMCEDRAKRLNEALAVGTPSFAICCYMAWTGRKNVEEAQEDWPLASEHRRTVFQKYGEGLRVILMYKRFRGGETLHLQAKGSGHRFYVKPHLYKGTFLGYSLYDEKEDGTMQKTAKKGYSRKQIDNDTLRDWFSGVIEVQDESATMGEAR